MSITSDFHPFLRPSNPPIQPTAPSLTKRLSFQLTTTYTRIRDDYFQKKLVLIRKNPPQSKTDEPAQKHLSHAIKLTHECSRYIFRKADRIGQGTFGIVFKGTEETTHSSVAIKIVPMSPKGTRYQSACIESDHLLRAVNIDHIVQIKDSFDLSENTGRAIIMEQVPVADLDILYLKNQGVPELYLQEIR